MPATALSMRDLDKIGTLEPDMRDPAARTYNRVQSELAASSPYVAILGTCRRSPAEQWKAYQINRHQNEQGKWVAIPGKKPVTNAMPWQSAHIVGRAFHIVWLMKPDGPWVPKEDPVWTASGEIIESEGWEWGGRWSSPVDMAHCEDPAWKEASRSEWTAIWQAWRHLV